MLAVMASAACAPPTSSPAPREPIAEVAATRRPAPERGYALSWGGAALGWAREHDDGSRWRRREQVVVARGDAIVATTTELVIERDDHGRVRSVELARWQDGPVLRGRATAVASGWWVEVDGEPALALPAAVPFELAIAREPETSGARVPVLLAGWGFAVATLSMVRDHDQTWTATLMVGDRPLVASVRYGDDGLVRELRGADGVIAREVALSTLTGPIEPVEVVRGSALAVEGADGAATPRAVWVPEATGPVPPPLPGQRLQIDPRPGWVLGLGDDDHELASLDPGRSTIDQTALAHGLARQVADEVEDDYGATALTAGGARKAERGDCTTHALRYAALAADRGLETRVVTGLRLDEGALIRHRWIMAWTGRRWQPIDPTYGEAPARPLLIGLAVHGPRAADLAMADAVVFDTLGGRAVALP